MPKPIRNSTGGLTIQKPKTVASRGSRTSGVQADSGGPDNIPNWNYPNARIIGTGGPQPSIDTGAVPYIPPPPGTGVGTGGVTWNSGRSSGGGGTPQTGWLEFDAGYTETPEWWKALRPDTWDDKRGQLALLNLLIPSLSPEDRRQVVSSIYLEDPETFAHLNPENIDFSPPGSIDKDVRIQYQGAQRANETLQALSRLAEATGKKDTEMGAGYSFLKLVSDAMRDTSSTQQQTRQQYIESTGAIEPTLDSMKSDTEARGLQGLASMLARPFFSTGRLQRADRVGNQFVFGEANPQLFF